MSLYEIANVIYYLWNRRAYLKSIKIKQEHIYIEHHWGVHGAYAPVINQQTCLDMGVHEAHAPYGVNGAHAPYGVNGAHASLGQHVINKQTFLAMCVHGAHASLGLHVINQQPFLIWVSMKHMHPMVSMEHLAPL